MTLLAGRPTTRAESTNALFLLHQPEAWPKTWTLNASADCRSRQRGPARTHGGISCEPGCGAGAVKGLVRRTSKMLWPWRGSIGVRSCASGQDAAKGSWNP